MSSWFSFFLRVCFCKLKKETKIVKGERRKVKLVWILFRTASNLREAQRAMWLMRLDKMTPEKDEKRPKRRASESVKLKSRIFRTSLKIRQMNMFIGWWAVKGRDASVLRPRIHIMHDVLRTLHATSLHSVQTHRSMFNYIKQWGCALRTHPQSL